MKLRYLIPIFVAVVAMFTGCNSEEEAIYLDGLRVSSSYVAIDKNGGSTQIKVTAAES